MAGQELVFRFLRADLDPEETAAVVAALLHRIAATRTGHATAHPRTHGSTTRAGTHDGAFLQPPGWAEQDTFQAPNSWSSG